MNRFLVLFFGLMLVCNVSFSAQGTAADTVISNSAILTGTGLGMPLEEIAMMSFLTVGEFYGLSDIDAPDSTTAGTGLEARIDIYLTNNGNDADNDAEIFISSFSNESPYDISNWDYYIEANGADVGTNYQIPFTQFGEGAIFHCILVIEVAGGTPTNDHGYFTVSSTTMSNGGHPAVLYSGLNGLDYGGYSNVSHSLRVDLILPNAVDSLFVEDGIDTLTESELDGSGVLRKTMNTITVEFDSLADNPGDSKVWYTVDGIADGPGGAAGDESVDLESADGFLFTAEISEDELENANFITFLFEVDNNLYSDEYTYRLKNLTSQGYETVIMNNVITPGVNEGFVQIPEECVGSEGKIEIYSISGDVVVELLDGVAENQIYSWDGTDDRGRDVSAGMYFLTIDFGDVREIRKFYINRNR